MHYQIPINLDLKSKHFDSYKLTQLSKDEIMKFSLTDVEQPIYESLDRSGDRPLCSNALSLMDRLNLLWQAGKFMIFAEKKVNYYSLDISRNLVELISSAEKSTNSARPFVKPINDSIVLLQDSCFKVFSYVDELGWRQQESFSISQDLLDDSSLVMCFDVIYPSFSHLHVALLKVHKYQSDVPVELHVLTFDSESSQCVKHLKLYGSSVPNRISFKSHDCLTVICNSEFKTSKSNNNADIDIKITANNSQEMERVPQRREVEPKMTMQQIADKINWERLRKDFESFEVHPDQHDELEQYLDQLDSSEYLQQDLIHQELDDPEIIKSDHVDIFEYSISDHQIKISRIDTCTDLSFLGIGNDSEVGYKHFEDMIVLNEDQKHISTFNGMAYISESKSHKRFISFSQKYCIVADHERFLYIYKQLSSAKDTTAPSAIIDLSDYTAQESIRILGIENISDKEWALAIPNAIILIEFKF